LKAEIVINGGEPITVHGVVAEMVAKIVEFREELQALEKRKSRVELNLAPRSVGLKWLVSPEPTERE